MRLFIAFPATAEVIKELMRVQAELINLNFGAVIKWTEPQNFHVTAEFLGELNEADAGEVKKILKKIVSKYQSFKYQLDKIDAFPDLRCPSVLMVRVIEEEWESLNLRQEIHDELKKLNLIGDDKPWQPHITLGRVKNEQAGISGLDRKLNPARPTGLSGRVEWEVGEVQLISSVLTAHGSEYEVLERYTLIRN